MLVLALLETYLGTSHYHPWDGADSVYPWDFPGKAALTPPPADVLTRC